MKIYQLRMENLDMWLEPVFGSRVAASRYKAKYKGRKIAIEELELAEKKDHVYRLSLNNSEGYDLTKDIFMTLEDVHSYIANSNIKDYQVYKENIIDNQNISFQLEGVCI